MRRIIEARVARNDWDRGQFWALEELHASGAAPFARPPSAEPAPATPRIPTRFDVCVELEPPPRLA